MPGSHTSERSVPGSHGELGSSDAISKEDVQILRERLFALDRTCDKNLTTMRQQLESQAHRIHELENKLRAHDLSVSREVTKEEERKKSSELLSKGAAPDDIANRLHSLEADMKLMKAINGTVKSQTETVLPAALQILSEANAQTNKDVEACQSSIEQITLQLQDTRIELRGIEDARQDDQRLQSGQTQDIAVEAREARPKARPMKGDLASQKSELFREDDEEFTDLSNNAQQDVKTSSSDVLNIEQQDPPGEISATHSTAFVRNHHLSVYYNLQDSVWDYALFVGSPEVGLTASAYLALLVAANAFLQVMLSLIINDLFTNENITVEDTDRMRHWRIHYGHSIDYMDKFSNQPTVKGLCQLKDGEHSSSVMGALLLEIEHYLPREASLRPQPMIGPVLPHMEGIGILLSSICVVIWLISVLNEIENIYENASSFFYIPRRKHTVISRGLTSNTLVSIDRKRAVWYNMILVSQTLVTAILACSGTFYIVRTLDLKDMLLNCSALLIVLEIDEGMAVFVPAHVRTLLETIDPLPRPVGLRYHGLGIQLLVKMAVVALVLVFSQFVLHKQADTLEKTREALCGGNLDFVAGTDKAGVVVVARSPLDFVENDRYFEDTMTALFWNDSAVAGRMSSTDGSSFFPSIRGGRFSLVPWLLHDREEVLSHYNSQCVDMLPVEDSPYDYSIHFLQMLKESLEKAAFNASITKCSHAFEYCFLENLLGERTRNICPVTCGCTHPESSIILLRPNGCPKMCYETSTWRNAKRERSCEDLELTSPYWSNIAIGLSGLVSTYVATGSDTPEILTQIKDNGCGVISNSSIKLNLWGSVWQDPCEDWRDVQMTSLTYGCPVTCGCAQRWRIGCPSKCVVPRVSIAPGDPEPE